MPEPTSWFTDARSSHAELEAIAAQFMPGVFVSAKVFSGTYSVFIVVINRFC